MLHVICHVAPSPAPYTSLWHYSQSERHIQLPCSFHHAGCITQGGGRESMSSLWLQTERCSFCRASVFSTSTQGDREGEVKVGGLLIVWSLWTPWEWVFFWKQAIWKCHLGWHPAEEITRCTDKPTLAAASPDGDGLLHCCTVVRGSWCKLHLSRRWKSRLAIFGGSTKRQICNKLWDLWINCYRAAKYACLTRESWNQFKKSSVVSPVLLSLAQHSIPRAFSSPLVMSLVCSSALVICLAQRDTLVCVPRTSTKQDWSLPDLHCCSKMSTAVLTKT